MITQEFIERWECNSCGKPCRVEIEHSGGDELKGQFEDKFQNRGCPCKSIYRPEWRKL